MIDLLSPSALTLLPLGALTGLSATVVGILAAGLMLGILVFVHEFGHFIVAKIFGVHVPVFSFGFGRRLFGFEFRGTDYRVSALPFGGYVRMAGADAFGSSEMEGEMLEDPSSGFLRKPVWQRLLIMVAGPGFNFILPIVVFSMLYMAGEPRPAATAGQVEHGSPAAAAGFMPGDHILSVAGQSVSNWTELAELVGDLKPGSHAVVVERDGATLELSLDQGADHKSAFDLGLDLIRPDSSVGVDDPASPAGRAGIKSGDRVVSIGGMEVEDFAGIEVALRRVGSVDSLPVEVEEDGVRRALVLQQTEGWTPHLPAAAIGRADAWGLLPRWLFVAEVSETLPRDAGELLGGLRPDVDTPSPAKAAGIQPGDRFLRIDGQPVYDWDDVLRGIQATLPESKERLQVRAVEVELVRAGTVLKLLLTPAVIEDTDHFGAFRVRPILGVVRAGGTSMGPEVRTYYGPVEAVGRATQETVLIAGFIVEQLGRILTREVAVQKSIGGPIEMVRQGSEAAQRGVFDWARMMGLLSISLAIINLLPVPVLDGGQILFYAVEGLRGRPLSAAIRERLQQVGVLFLVLLMMFVVVFDIQRWLTGGS